MTHSTKRQRLPLRPSLPMTYGKCLTHIYLSTCLAGKRWSYSLHDFITIVSTFVTSWDRNCDATCARPGFICRCIICSIFPSPFFKCDSKVYKYVIWPSVILMVQGSLRPVPWQSWAAFHETHAHYSSKNVLRAKALLVSAFFRREFYLVFVCLTQIL